MRLRRAASITRGGQFQSMRAQAEWWWIDSKFSFTTFSW
jgi:hypothetical protein